ncbi:MAG: Holliday junction resolvase RuvX [Chloroflexi bacterium]|nr:Holliday junction resolvase RuvX [Chloroflexota bacterium]
MRVMGLDVGDVRTGVALSDPTGSIAAPLKTIQAGGRDRAIEEIAILVEENGVERVVVGLPVSLDGGLGPQARKVERFCEALGSRLAVPLVTWDESFSSTTADRVMRESGGRRSRRKGRRDSVAAAVILQEYLDSLGLDSGNRHAGPVDSQGCG